MDKMFLNTIVAETREELAQRQKAVSLAELEAIVRDKPSPLDFAAALRGDSLRLIAEVKRASPSRGVLRHNLEPVKLAETYARGGAAAISVLTEAHYFQGSLVDLEAIRRKLPDMPLLRKDFIFEPYMVFESRAWGADALLLILAILDDNGLKELLSLSQELGMQCLVEVHNEEELKRALATDARIIGINNRDLDTMAVDINVTRRLRPLIPPDRLVVSESGIKGREDIEKLRELGINCVLVGEALVTAGDIAAKLKELL
jgi:indole-3-glycerol phosphate synthase